MAKRRKGKHEEEGADEAWLLPYSDLMTLLLAVFIVLFATSTQDAEKMQKMSQAFQGIFGSGTSILDGGESTLDDGYTDSTPNIWSTVVPFEEGLTSQQISQQQQQQLDKLENAFKTYIVENDLSDSIQTIMTGNKITVTLASDILFPSGSADLTAQQKERAQVIADIIADVQSGGYPIAVKISGHTDNTPMNTLKYPSNFHLSIGRATNFMMAMVENSGLDPRLFTVTGYGEMDPIDTNETAVGKSHNRRVEIQLSYQSASEE